MALQDKMKDRAQPYLEPGEEVRQVFLGQTGPNPAFALITYLIVFFSKYWIVVVTDRAILVFEAGKMAPTRPKTLRRRYPRALQLGPVSGLWGDTMAFGQQMWVHRRYQKAVAAADAELIRGGGRRDR